MSIAAMSYLRISVICSLSTCRARNHCLEFNQPVSPFLAWQHGIVDKVVFSKIREKLIGGKVHKSYV